MADGKSIAAHLRMPFPPEHIGHLPRGGIQIDYVGHADVTSRLLEVDHTWNWEPLATDEHGLPWFDTDERGNPVGLWIRLTVGEVTRLGYGSCPSNQHDAVKVLIGDALRNAAMRFGVALDLWAKGDRDDPTRENATGSAGQAQRKRPQQRREPPAPARPTEVPGADGWGEWADAINDISSPEEAQKVEDDLLEQYREGKMAEPKVKAIQKAIHYKARTVSAA